MPLKSQRHAIPNWVASISLPTVKALSRIAFPLQDVLRHSLYYPASGFDGRPVQMLAGFLHSFVYVDYGVGEKALAAATATGFKGYRLAGRKSLAEADLAPNGWRPIIPPHRRHEVDEFWRIKGSHVRPPFGEWLIFERLPDVNEEHGPERFSLTYIGADGVATYQALYLQNQTAPKVLAIIQPGTGWGGNYTDFRKPDGFLAEVVLTLGKDTVPEYLMCGEQGSRPPTAFWPDPYSEFVEAWYEIGIWKRLNR